MTDVRTALLLAGIMALVAFIAMFLTAGMLYYAALGAQADRLADLVAARSELIEAVARHDAEVAPVSGFASARAATLAQLKAAHRQHVGLGRTGELMLVRRQGDDIEYLWRVRHGGGSDTTRVAWASELAEPSRRALQGLRGTMEGLDYRGERVLAAYGPIPILDAGLVAKIDLAEIRAPFIRIGLIALAVVALMVAAGTAVYLRIVTPLVRDRLDSEARLQSIVDNVADGILVVDEEGTAVYANASGGALFGRRPEEMKGLPVGRSAMAADTGTLDILPRGGPPRIAEVRAVDVEWDGRTAHLLSLRDITERDRIARELHLHHELLQNILDNIPAMVSWRDRDLNYQGANRNFALLTGHESPDDITGRADQDLPWTAEEAARRQAADRAVMASGEARSAAEELLRRHDGCELPVVANRAPLYDAEGRVSGVLEVAVDVTELKQTQHKLQQALKMEAIGKLTGGIAHDFNNLLGVVLGNLQLMERFLTHGSGEVDERIPRRVHAAMDAVSRGAVLTRRLLAFSRRQMLEPRLLDLNTLVAEMDDLLSRSLGETVAVHLTLAGDLWTCKVDPGQTESALLNLAINARDAMPQGGTLWIETYNVVLDDAYVATHQYVIPGEYVCLVVSDEGTGMSEEVLSQVFEPFFTTKEAAKGSGLGLSMVYGFAKQSSGYVNIYSEEGLGTTVKLYFPRAHGTAEAAAPTVEGEAVVGGTETLLVAEDNDALRAAAVDYLRTLGYRVMEAATGAEVLDVLEGHPEVALLFTDVVMPGGMNGFELARRARVLRPNLAVLLASGFAREALTTSQEGDNMLEGLMTKPYRFEVLARRIREQLDAG